jgi:hypothetical protein
MAIEQSINTLVQNGPVVILTVQAAIDGYAALKFFNWFNKQ